MVDLESRKAKLGKEERGRKGRREIHELSLGK